MRVADFYFELPESLIALYPQAERSACQLLSLDGVSGEVTHGVFSDLLTKLEPGDLLVFNDTKVIPARLFGKKSSGGKVEVLVERVLDEHRVLAHVKASKAPQPDSRLVLGETQCIEVTVLARHDSLFELYFHDDREIFSLLEEIGHIPLPPYINRADEQDDRSNYQTVYCAKPGAVAAPTAGLHFDEKLLAALKEKGINMAFVTLHVGAGTFQPVRVEHVEEHIMHSEYVEVSQEVVDAVIACKKAGKRVIAVGTTSVRSLESAAQQATNAIIAPLYQETNIFIYPGYTYQIVDALITNFHLPGSTLIMLVAAFAGYNNVMRAYETAIQCHYRFFSYGDAMFITPNANAGKILPFD